MNWEEYEKKCDEIREENSKYLDIFEQDLKGLTPKTVRRHLNIIGFFINEYLLRERPKSMDKGIMYIDDFLGYFYIKKCVWSTPANIKSSAASIKKFYKSMMNHNVIKKEDYDFLF